MSLMNDALRKKNRETTEGSAAPGFCDTSKHPRKTKKWFFVLATMILLTAASLVGIHMVQSAPTNAMLVKNLLPERSQPPVNRAADIPSAVEHQADVTPIQAPSEGETTTKVSIEPPLEPPQRDTDAVSRAFEPGPDETVAHKKSAPAAPRSPVYPAPSPAPRVPTETLDQQNVGAADQQTTTFDQDTNPFFNKALAYHRSNRMADAVRLYRQVLKSNANHRGAMLNLAAAYMEQGNYFDAHPILKRLEQSTPRPEGVLLNLAISVIGMGTPEKALDYLDRANAASDASPWEIRFHRAVAFARMNRLPEALVLYREAEVERPDNPLLQFNLAVTCDTLGMYPEALAHYETVLQTPPEPSATDKKTIIKRIRTIQRYLDTAPSPAKGK